VNKNSRYFWKAPTLILILTVGSKQVQLYGMIQRKSIGICPEALAFEDKASGESVVVSVRGNRGRRG
jgi:hypothetical protein